MSTSSQSSSVLVQHSPPPPHTFSSFTSDLGLQPAQPEQTSIAPEAVSHNSPDASSPQTVNEPAPQSTDMPDTPMADAPPPVESEPDPEPNTEAEQGNATTEESQLRPQDSLPSEPVPVSTDSPPTNVADSPTQDAEPLPLPPPEPRIEPPDWVVFEEDLSKPTPEEEEELRVREYNGTELTALNVPSMEKRVFHDVDDPDARPIKKMRLSWVIKGVRGTKEKPNHARVMISPPALVDGTYWQIKFYPRGNKASSYSAYIRCSKKPPPTDRPALESTFSCFEGLPDADLGTHAVPTLTETTAEVTSEDDCAPQAMPPTSTNSEKQDVPAVDDTGDAEEIEAQADESPEDQDAQVSGEDWRISAQLGVVMYNPAEPRTFASNASEHQFSPHTDDWGWANVAGPWRDTHLRQHMQRAPLLQNDTIAIDAYIRIFEDSTKALWWRSSESEPHWDSHSLAGYFPMGTPPLYHSPAVAGMTAWLLLAPFRKIIQDLDVGRWRTDSRLRPQPFLAQLQIILFLMRRLNQQREAYVDLHPAIQAMEALGEEFSDVTTFWEAFRRTIELELENEDEALRALKAIFDSPSNPVALPPLPVENVLDVQQSLSQVLREKQFQGRLPIFLPLMLARDKFDTKQREWKLLHDRVILNDELDMSEFVDDVDHAKYTLYGFMVHTGARNSGKFYTILQPNGPGTMWLAFEDGDGNQVFSYCRKSLHSYEGLEGQALKDLTATRATAYMAMYIKTSCLGDYLPGTLESYKLPKWLVPHIANPYREGPENFQEDHTSEELDEVQVEVYSDEFVIGTEALVDSYNIKQMYNAGNHVIRLSSSRKGTVLEIRQQLAEKLGCDDPKAIRLYAMEPRNTGNHATAQLLTNNARKSIKYLTENGQPLCLWMSIIRTKEDIELFGGPDTSHDLDVDTSHEPDVSIMTIDDIIAPSMPQSAVPPPVSTTNQVEQQEAAQDIEQASVEAAVVADLMLFTSGPPPPPAEIQDEGDPVVSTRIEHTPPTVEESLGADVPHGHLIDAAIHDSMVAVPDDNTALDLSAGPASVLSPAEEAVITAVFTEAADVTDVVMESSSDTSGQSGTNSHDSSSQSASSSSEIADKRVDNAYGLIQRFDVYKQTFRIESVFFAKYDESVRDFVQNHMGYETEKKFAVWHRHSMVEGCMVSSEDTFRDLDFPCGRQLVVYETLSEAQIKEFEKDGKFTNPHDLSKHLRAIERRHPVRSMTSTEPVELADFSMEYYKGPLLNGRHHGAHCLSINSVGNVYEGPLVSNVKSGKGGKMTYSNGDTYEGEWSEDERHGQGTFVEARTGNKYVGGFENGKRWGMGTTYWQVADEQADLCQICYGNEIDALFFDCGHVCACVECARQCELCPICRKNVKQVVKMFRS